MIKFSWIFLFVPSYFLYLQYRKDLKKVKIKEVEERLDDDVSYFGDR